jgi:hypothetical protein
MERLLVAVIGNRHSGKSHTWNTLFEEKVKTGKYQRALCVGKSEYVDVFLASGSPEERRKYVGKIIADKGARIVLCSIQYTEEAWDTVDYFLNRGFFPFVHWLNPGYSDPGKQPDELGLISYITFKRSLLGIRDAQGDATARVEELRDFIRGWAKSRNLIREAP